MRIIKHHTLIKPANNYVIDAPQPSNISYWWNVGSLLGLALGIQIITGVTLAMHYNANVLEAFNSVEHIMRDVNNGWLIRYLHANAASAFFFLVYLHIGRGLYYGSYKAPRTLTWVLGTIILILMMATAFLGYVLPYGQMSLWGATVITNLLSAIPWVGQSIVEFVWGGFSVNNATLNRFFSLHFVLPFILAALVLMHLIALHDTAGSNNPLGVSGNYDRIPFAPYFIFKDIITIFIFMWILSLFVFFVPNVLGDSENYVMANPMQTPPAIVPEWYLLPFYAILRSIPNKLLGVISMFSAILIILYMTVGDVSKLRGSQFKPLTKGLFFFFIGNLLLLLVLGAKHVESPFIEAGQAATVIYFVYFGLIVPASATFENSINEFYIFIKNTLSKTKEKYDIYSNENMDSLFNDKKLLKSFLPTPLCFLPQTIPDFPDHEPFENAESKASREFYLRRHPEESDTLPSWQELYRILQQYIGVEQAKGLVNIHYGDGIYGSANIEARARALFSLSMPAGSGILHIIRNYKNSTFNFDAKYDRIKSEEDKRNIARIQATLNNPSPNQTSSRSTINLLNKFILTTNILMLITNVTIICAKYNMDWKNTFYVSLNALLDIKTKITNGFLSYINIIINRCDAPTPWGLYFQDSASPQMEALAELHDNIMFYLVIILFAVGWMLAAACVKFFKWVISNKFVSHGSLVEIIWTFSPGIILILIAFTSFKLLYLMDEVSDVNMSLYIEGHQWYWSYQYPDFLNEDGEFIEYDSYLTPDSDLEPGAIRMLDVDERVILPELTHVRFIVSSGDVIHCYACPSLGIKADAYPGRLNQASALINRLGTFYGQCSEICGILHSSMPIAIESVTLEKFLLFLWEK